MQAKSKPAKTAKPKKSKPARYQGSAFLRDISRAVDEAMQQTGGSRP